MKKKKGKIKPNFDIYSEGEDSEVFKEKSPKAYRRICLVGILALILPMLVFLAYAMFINPAPNSGFLLLVFAGCFIMGVGFFNIVAAWMNAYLGHWFTAICLLLGGALAAVGMVLMYVPDIYALFDEEMVNHYFSQLLMSIFLPAYYADFRSGMNNWMKRKKIGNKKTREELKEGAKNYWFYQALHEEYGLGARYYLNKVFLFIAVPALFLCVFLGWYRPLATVTAAALSAGYLLSVPMGLMASIENNIAVFGKPFVFKYRKKSRSSLTDLFMAATAFLMVYCIITMTLKLHQ